MMKTWVAVAVMMVGLVLPGVARAHEGHVHKALGTIAGVQGVHVELKTTDGKMLTVMLDKETTITRGKEKVDASALKAGERISVDYMEENKMMMARAIKLATTTAQAKK
jgi:hypothetical protein